MEKSLQQEEEKKHGHQAFAIHEYSSTTGRRGNT
jgi:hypothetical protein